MRWASTRWVHREAWDFLSDSAGERIEQLQCFDLVVEELDADGQLAVLRRKNIDGVATHPERPTRKILFVARVLHADQPPDHIALADFVADAHDEAHLRVVLGRADAVDGAHRRHDDRVASLQHALGRRQPHLLDVLVDGAVFFDEQVALRHVGLGLVIVVVADEVLDGVMRKKFAELAVKLRRQRLVRCEDDGRPAEPGDHVGHGEGFAGTSHAQQGLEHLAIVHAFDQAINRFRLIARRRIGLVKLEGRAGKSDERSRLCGPDRCKLVCVGHCIGDGFGGLWHGCTRQLAVAPVKFNATGKLKRLPGCTRSFQSKDFLHVYVYRGRNGAARPDPRP